MECVSLNEVFWLDVKNLLSPDWEGTKYPRSGGMGENTPFCQTKLEKGAWQWSLQCFNILTFIFRQYKPADVEALVLRKEEAVKKEQQQPQQQQQQSKKRRVISKQQQQQQQRKLSNPRWWIRE